MPTNDFLSWASGGSANVMPQADYAGAGTRTNGVQSGTASSELANKTWRQGANMAAAIGGFITDFEFDALDDGDIAALTTSFENALFAAIAALFSAGGATLAETLAGIVAGKFVDPEKLAAAINSGAYVSATAGGSANALTATLAPAPAAYVQNMRLRVKIATTNTGAATINVNSLGAKSITRLDGTALGAGDLLAGMVAEIVYDGTQFQLLNRRSRVLNGLQVFTSAGTSSFTVPAGIFSLRARVWGGGGGGGGVGSGGGGASGGAGGGYSEKLCAVTPGQVITVTVGAGGSAGSGSPTNGGTGGSSSFGAFCSATGGGGGTAQSGGGVSGANGSVGVGSGGDINIAGAASNAGLVIGSATLGASGGGAFAALAVGSLSTSAGNGAASPGSGGGGAGGPTFNAGGPGAAGMVQVEW